MERTIRITGKGTAALKPNQITLALHMNCVEKKYADSLSRSANEVKKLRDALIDIGFDRDDLKTTDFSINTQYRSYQDKNGNWKNRFEGYRTEQDLKLVFPLQNTRLGEVLNVITQTQTDPQIDIAYTVKEIESAKNQLLESAIKDSREKANILTNAAGVSLGDILSIDYSWGEISFVSPTRPMLARETGVGCVDNSMHFDIDAVPEDIRVSDTVTVIWQIR